MKKILFNSPLKKDIYFKSIKNFFNSKKSLHGLGDNIFGIKKKVKSYFGFQHIHLTNSLHQRWKCQH